MAIVKQHLPRHPHRHFHAMQPRLQSEELTQEMKLSQQGRLNAQRYLSHTEHSFRQGYIRSLFEGTFQKLLNLLLT